MAFKELSGGSGGNILKWQTAGQVVEGRLIGTKRGKVFNGRPSTLAIVAHANGTQTTMPLPTVLEGRFIENDIKPGTTIRVTYLGLVAGKQGGAQYKDFRLEADDSTIGQPLPAILAPAVQPAQPAVQPPAATPPVAQPATVPVAPVVPASEYDGLAAKLMEKVGAAAAGPMLNALAQLYPDPATRTEQLKLALRTQGVQV